LIQSHFVDEYDPTIEGVLMFIFKLLQSTWLQLLIFSRFLPKAMRDR